MTSLPSPKPFLDRGGFASLRLQMILIAALCPFVIGLQVLNRAYQSDLGGHADEPAHVVTGLMLRDYMAGPVWKLESPVGFAKDYYARYPKVALGHYPPVFYLLEGLWTIPIRSRAMILLFCALITATTASLVIRLGVPLLGWPVSIAAGLAFCLYRPVQTYTAIVMSDLMMVGWSLAALIAWRRFGATKQGGWSLLFGGFAAAAILTKGSGLALALVPGLAMLLLGQLQWLKLRSLWLAPVPVLLFALPWMAATSHITREGMTGQSTTAFLAEALPYYLREVPATFGWIPTAALLWALVLLGKDLLAGKRPSSTQALLWSMLAASFLLCCAVPAGLDGRYLLPILPSTILLGANAVQSSFLGRLGDFGLNARLAAWAKGLLLAAILVAGKHQAPAKWVTGPSKLAEAMASVARAEKRPLRLLVTSDATGEGALVAEAALRAPKLLSVQRGTKILSTSDWMGRGYEVHFDSQASLVDLLKAQQIDYLVIDDGVREAEWTPHQRLINELLGGHDVPELELALSVPAERRDHASQLRVFRVKPAARAP
jgi:hypothetical protein